MTQEVLKLALECAERCDHIDGMYSWTNTITAIKEALAQTQEPVAWRSSNWGHSMDEWVYRDADDPVLTADGKPSPSNEPLYTTPPQRTWVGLTDEEVRDLWSWSATSEAEKTANTQQHAFAQAIEAKLKELNT